MQGNAHAEAERSLVLNRLLGSPYDGHASPAGQDDPDRAAAGQRHRAGRDLDVSRHHAELRRNQDGSFEIIDLGSHGGTYVNGERITRKMLTEQDIISIGHATFRLSGGELRQLRGRKSRSLACHHRRA